jgi:hypothetical protein
MPELPTPIAALIDATNRGDRAAFVNTFALDATVTDGDRTFSGRDEIARWDDSDNIGAGMHFDLASIIAIGPSRYAVTLTATSRRFSGTGTMHIMLRDNAIASLTVG